MEIVDVAATNEDWSISPVMPVIPVAAATAAIMLLMTDDDEFPERESRTEAMSALTFAGSRDPPGFAFSAAAISIETSTDTPPCKRLALKNGVRDDFELEDDDDRRRPPPGTALHGSVSRIVVVAPVLRLIRADISVALAGTPEDAPMLARRGPHEDGLFKSSGVMDGLFSENAKERVADSTFSESPPPQLP